MARQAAEATRGFPYLMQLVGYYLVDNATPGETLKQEAFCQAVSLARRDLADSVFRPTLDALSARDVDVLAAMAQDEGRSSTAQITARLGVSNGYFQNYRKRLVDAGVVEAPRHGELEFAVPYLADYLRGGRR